MAPARGGSLEPHRLLTLTAELDHFELPVGDADRMADFLGRVFEWSAKERVDIAAGTYRRVSAGSPDRVSVGLLEGSAELLDRPLPVVRLEGESLDGCLERVVACGGTVTLEPRKVEGGRFARFTDPDGHEWGLWARRD
ncbi:MAG: VOC family protein [Thermoanaerobaculia bacterium]